MSLPKDIVPDHDEARRRQLDDPLLGSVAAAADTAGLACPDAETLGLYAEQALASVDAATIAAHVQGCARCEAVVASLARALPGALTPGVTPEPASTGVAGWVNGWRWLVPAMSLAGAAVVAVWLGRAPASEMQMARTDAGPTATTAAPAAPVETPSGAASREADARAQATQAVPAPLEAPAMAAAPSRRTAAVPAPAGAAAAAPPDSPIAAERQAVAEALADRRASAEATANAAGAASPRPSETAAFAPAAPAAAAPPSADAAREERARSQTLGRAKEAEPQARAGAAAQGAADFRAAYARWRVRDGVLEFARDGRAWRRVAVPTDERLASVTERPDASVLVITASGVEFVSTDLGATWQRQ